MRISGKISSMLGYLVWLSLAESLWKSDRHRIPPGLREIIAYAATSRWFLKHFFSDRLCLEGLEIMQSDTRCDMQHLRRILEQRVMILTVELTNICNASCRFCAYRYQKRERSTISDELFKYAVCEFAGIGGGILNLTPIVGDPLVDKNLISKIKYARKMKEIQQIFFFTNLIGLSDFDINDLLLSGIDKINVSVCIGSKEMYTRVYGVDKYDSVMQNLDSLLMENRRLGDRVNIKVHVKGERPFSQIRLSSEYQRISEVYGKGIAQIDETFDNWTGIIREDDLPKGCALRAVKDRSEPCMELYNGMIVFTNGNVGICWRRDVEAQLVIGNIQHSSLESIWRGRNLRVLRDNWLNGNIPPPCRKCYCYTPLSRFLLSNRSAIQAMEQRVSRKHISHSIQRSAA
jgi:radical SAM protein with 4Fe4S-binding SPASM domain